jgi:hypothetical protein
MGTCWDAPGRWPVVAFWPRFKSQTAVLMPGRSPGQISVFSFVMLAGLRGPNLLKHHPRIRCARPVPPSSALGAPCNGSEGGGNALQRSCERRQHPALAEPLPADLWTVSWPHASSFSCPTRRKVFMKVALTPTRIYARTVCSPKSPQSRPEF